MSELFPTGHPRFNHVAMSVDAGLLEGTDRDDLTRFFSEVFGFEELPTMTVDRHRLVYSCGHWDQFIFLIADDHPMHGARMDHYGFAVGSIDELHAARDRAAAFREADPRVDLIDVIEDDHGVVKIHSIYVGFLLPMMCELQFWELPTSR
ncbi:MAG: hypothetical protein MUE36_00050 [Acidimicrobiales bacterium]|jgi:hypothetical protein|nr:hypothetical protein [Acidimicrobiales bacterium]